MPEQTDFECIPLELVESVPARLGLDVWAALRGRRRFPSRAELKLRDLASIVQYMSLIAVIDGGRDFENRFVGDAVVRAHEVPINHRRFSEIALDMPVLMQRFQPLCRRVVDSGAPLAYRGRTGHDMARVVYTDFEGVLLPLGLQSVDYVMYVGTCTLQVNPPPLFAHS